MSAKGRAVHARRAGGRGCTVGCALALCSALACGGGGKAEPARSGQLLVDEVRPWGASNGQDLVWASFTVKDGAGALRTGLAQADFALQETLVGPDGKDLETRAVAFDRPADQFSGPGFWERSVTAQVVDLVLVIDVSGSMADRIAAVRTELRELVDGLASSHADFRVAAIRASIAVGDLEYEREPFRGPMELAELHAFLDRLGTGSDSYAPPVTYDAVLLAADADFRPAARKAIFVVSDNVPQTVYGSYWYAIDSSAATRSAVESRLRASGIGLLFSIALDQGHGYDTYARETVNPRATAERSGFAAIAAAGLATDLGYPVDAAKLGAALGAAGGPVVDSRYYLAWRSGFAPMAHPERHQVRVTASAPDPGRPGEKLVLTFTYVPIVRERATLTLEVSDEAGHPVDEAWIWLRHQMGDRWQDVFGGQLLPRAGVVTVPDLPVGRYGLRAVGANAPSYAYQQLRYAKTGTATLPVGGARLALELRTGDRTAELARVSGLLDDLERWGAIERPFADFAAGARAWLDGLEAGPITWVEMERVKRLGVALSAYANASGYAELEAARIVDDLWEVVKKFQEILGRLREASAKVDDAWPPAIAEAIARLDQATLADLNSSQWYVTALNEFAKGDLAAYLERKLVEQIPNEEYKALLALVFDNLVQSGDWSNWGDIVDAIVKMGLREAVDQVKDLLTEQIAAGIPGNTELDGILRDALRALGKDGFTGLQSYLRSVEARLRQLDKAEALARIEAAFAQLRGSLDGGPLRDFVLPMAKLVAESAVQDGAVSQEAVVKAICGFFVQELVVKPWFSEPLRGQLVALDARVRGFAPLPEDRGARAYSMAQAFKTVRERMGPVQTSAWSVLGDPSTVDDVLQVLETVTDMLGYINPVAKKTCVLGYPTCLAWDDLGHLRDALAGIGILSKVFQISLKTADLTSFRNDLAPVAQEVLAEH